MAAGLFYVYTEPGSVDEAEFHDWYDREHGPARLKVPGFGGAYRYRAFGFGAAAGTTGVRPAQHDRCLAVAAAFRPDRLTPGVSI